MKRFLSVLLVIMLSLFMVGCASVNSDIPSYGDSSPEIENSEQPNDGDTSSKEESSQTPSGTDSDNLDENELPFVPKN